MGLYSNLKTLEVSLSSATKTAAFRVDGGMTIMAIETASDWTPADVTFEASSQEFDGSNTFTLDDTRFKPCYGSDGQPVKIPAAPASGNINVGATLTGHYFKLESSETQTSTVRVHYRHIA